MVSEERCWIGISLTGLVAMTRADEIFSDNADAKVKEVKAWLTSKGVRNFEPVSLFCDSSRRCVPL